MIAKEKISVFMPANNEAENLPKVLEKIDIVFKKYKIRGEVIVVNDGSKDNTKFVLDMLCKKYKYLSYASHNVKKGISECFNTAFKYVKGDIIILLPSDLQSDPEEDIPKLLNKMKEGYDLVCGVREKWNRPKSKVLQSKSYSLMSRILFKNKIMDFNWIRAFKRDVIKDINLRKDWHRYFVIQVLSKGYRVGEVGVNEYPRKKGRSKFNFGRVFTGVIDMFAVKFYLSFLDNPLYFFSIPGLLMIFTSFVLGVFLVIDWLFAPRTHFPLYFLTVMLFIAGIIFVGLGFLAEMIVALREDIRKK